MHICLLTSNSLQMAVNLLITMMQVSTLRLLDLSGNALQGTLPVSLGSALQQLVVLLLGSNALSGTLPSAWSNMPNLQVCFCTPFASAVGFCPAVTDCAAPG